MSIAEMKMTQLTQRKLTQVFRPKIKRQAKVSKVMTGKAHRMMFPRKHLIVRKATAIALQYPTTVSTNPGLSQLNAKTLPLKAGVAMLLTRLVTL